MAGSSGPPGSVPRGVPRRAPTSGSAGVPTATGASGSTVRVRLFGPARTAFGAPECELKAASVGDVLDALRGRGSDELRSLLDRSRLWVNGEPAELSAPLGEHDEVAVVPPVSGGS